MLHSSKKLFRSILESKAFWIVLIVALTTAIYLKVLHFGFINWDDDRNIYNNEVIKKLDAKSIKLIFTSFQLNMYQPFTTLSYALEFKLFGLNPGFYHLNNLLLHILNSLLVFVFISRISKNNLIAGITALLFGIHPMHTESVAWVTERKDVLYTFFFLCSLIFYQKFTADKPKFSSYTFSLLFFLFSLLSKSAAVVLPVILMIIDFLHGNVFKIRSLLNKIPFFIVALLFGILSLYSQHVLKNPELVVSHFTLFDRMIFGLYALFFYISKAFWPLHLSAFHPFPLKIGLFLPVKFYIGSAVILIGILLLVLAKTKKWLSKDDFENAGWGLMFFTITIAIVLFIPVGSAYVAERYSYLPYLGLFYIVGYVVYSITIAGLKRKINYLLIIVTVAFNAFLCLNTFYRLDVWKDSLSFWNNIIKNYPRQSPLAYYNRGVTYYELDKSGQAIEDYTAAISQKPDYFDAYYSRGLARFKISDLSGALSDYNFFLKYNPSNPDALINRGQILGQTGDLNGAMNDFNKAITLKPNDYLPWFNRAVINQIQGNSDMAVQDFCRAILLNPGYALSYYYRGLVYKSSGHRAEACDDLNKALQMGCKDAASVLVGYCN